QQRPDQFPLRIRQIPATHDCSSKSSLESEQGRFGNPFCQHGLERLASRYFGYLTLLMALAFLLYAAVRIF
ncbi:MAG: hypothetical protein U0S50_17920, partial [Sphingopyxis sp.]|uniref:hypothetical protein n=1 Tax=Sphingopyxis sp. TaxID=1908224 RepID=UPI002ABCEE3A